MPTRLASLSIPSKEQEEVVGKKERVMCVNSASGEYEEKIFNIYIYISSKKQQQRIEKGIYEDVRRG